MDRCCNERRVNKGFTLIELLIVVAIIGILAAIGATVIPGLLAKTKITAVKEQHANVVNFIKLQKARCDTGSKTMELVTASGGNYEPPCSDFLNISQMPNNIYKMSQHLIGIGFKNPLEPSYAFHQHSGGYCSKTSGFAPGCTEIDCTTCAQNKGSAIMTVKTCFEGSCTNAETLTDVINFN